MFIFHEYGNEVLCDDGRKCKSRAIVTKDDIFQSEYNSEKIEDILKKSEIKYIY